MLRLNLGLIPSNLFRFTPKLRLGDEDNVVLARDEMTVAPEVSEAQEGELTTAMCRYHVLVSWKEWGLS